MKLGIIVVYLFDENTEYLLDLHISYIRKFTDVPYTIYGSISRLNLKERQKLSKYPEVQQYDIPPTDLRGSFEHAFYLDHLVEIAIQEGSTHIVTLHLDSFPVYPGWARKFEALTDQTGSCVALDYYYTACFFFTKDFYLRFRPKFSIAAEALELAHYVEFMKKYKIINHSGSSYLYICYTNHLSWHVLKNSSGESSLKCGDIFGGLIFHLRSAVALSLDSRTVKENNPDKIKSRKLAITWMTFLGRHLSTYTIRKWIRKNLPHSPFCLLEKWLIGQRELINIMEMESCRAEIESVKTKFIEDPEAYFFKLQNSLEVASNAIQRYDRF